MGHRVKPGESFVICMECDRQLHQVTFRHLLYNHGMTLDEYKAKWPDAATQSTGTVAKRVEAATTYANTPAGIARSSAVMTAYNKSELGRINASLARMDDYGGNVSKIEAFNRSEKHREEASQSLAERQRERWISDPHDMSVLTGRNCGDLVEYNGNYYRGPE